RCEQPPPGYFNELPRQVWTRLERSETEKSSFWTPFFSRQGMNPAVAYGFGLIACATLIFGIGYALKTEPETTLARPMAEDSWRLTAPGPALAAEKPLHFSPDSSNLLSSTNPVLNAEPLPSFFNGLKLKVEPVSFDSSR
ncbi:MAG: hypothetical protein M3Y82_05850, partial [Verrucomicrobiota bacterium]|nr:hypothetical protein [Verrucomicrobiota bacterium]